MEDSESARRLRAYIVGMPSLPTTVSKVLEVCNNPRASPADLDRVIQLDPVLMGRVLKLINSAYYGLGNQVTSLARAIIMLGINTVKNLALSSAVLESVPGKKDSRALNMDGFWRHSLGVGATAKLIAKRRGVEAKSLEDYFAAGLLHDIGKIPLNNALPDEYVRALSVADFDRVSLVQAERRVLGLDHCEAGGIIAESWKLSGSIAAAIRWHHDLVGYAGECGDVLRTVAIADFFANREGIGSSGNRYPDRISPETFELLGIEKSLLEELEDPVKAEIEKAKVFLKIGG